MPLTWKLSDWLRGRSVMLRHRRRATKARLALESLEQRVVPSSTGAVTGVAFIDTNANSTKDTGELIVKGAKLHLTGTSDAGDTVNAQTTTDQQGTFSFTLVPAGTYTLKADSSTAITGGATVTVHVADTSVTQDLAVGTVAPDSLSLREFLNTSVAANTSDAFPFLTAGTGQTTGINLAPTLRDGQPANISVSQSTTAQTKTVDLAGVFDDPNFVTSQVTVHTSGGDVNVDLFDKEAPQTVQNFYNYVNSGAYNNSIFHRLAAGFVLQGGGFKYNPKVDADSTTTPPTTASPASITAIPTDPAVQNEFSATRSNVAGTVAMAKLGNDPNSATNQFFFNLADNHTNLDNQNGGFTVFGKVVGPDDTKVVNSLSDTSATSSIKVTDESTATGITDANVKGALNQLPLKGYKEKTPSQFPTDTTTDNFLRITGVDTTVRDEVLTYSVVAESNTNPGLVTPTIVNNRLTVSITAGQSGTADFVIRATDKKGATVDATFHVIVNPT